ncbi:cysteine hydrolase [Oryzomonas japonica]|uniref:Cysteine hydrolase n=1 Tax=Oryzomonas japonica TaxID=2603858 RepID=A0A7J4ZP82_9BACT|nr:cysteine hydrolase [Oryzomonas japonica]KAB0664222.1 cysteine hydrolase [Oryzomonas japonica]
MKLEPSKTAVLTLDLQKGILAMVDGYESVLPNASRIVELARKKKYQLVHVGLGFSEGHPAVADWDTPFLRAQQNNLFVKGSPSAEFHSTIAQPGDLIIYKQRIGAFSENHLNLTLRARGIENLVLFGISTSGIVLATVTRAFDLDFRLTIIRDACCDADAEVHRVLTEKIFPKRGAVTTTDAFISEQE